jgi:deoxyribose-phosphate aldolase
MAAVVVLPTWVPLAAERLLGSGVAVCSVVGFPLAHTQPTVLAAAATRLASDGATEVDMVLSIGAFLADRRTEVADEVAAVVQAFRGPTGDRLVKVIMETHLLDDETLPAACALVEGAGARYVKTTTGFTGGGATPEEVARLKVCVGDRLGVKASSGIRTLEQAFALVDAGADRLGTSAGAEIARAWEELQRDAHAV